MRSNEEAKSLFLRSAELYLAAMEDVAKNYERLSGQQKAEVNKIVALQTNKKPSEFIKAEKAMSRGAVVTQEQLEILCEFVELDMRRTNEIVAILSGGSRA